MEHFQDRSGEYVSDYRLLRRRGLGTFGEVYQAEDRRSHSPVAVKLLKASVTHREDLRAFLNEARAFRLHHPHIVPLLDFGLSEHDLPFLVMEYVAGGTLRQRYPKGSKVPLDVVVALTSQLASALRYAHDQHLVHRDVKPENMLCRTDGTVLLSDFGIASVSHASSSLSLYEGIGGTLPYMAPEQIAGKPRRESDQYALAVVVYEWLAGARPFQGTAPELISQHLYTSPPSLLDQVPTLPTAVEQVVFKALSKQPQERFSHIDDFAAALQAASQLVDAPLSTMTPSPLVLSSSLPESAPSLLSPSSPAATAPAGWSPSTSTRPTQPAQGPKASFFPPTPSPTSSAPLPNERDAIPPSTPSVEFPSTPPSLRDSSPTRQRRRFRGCVIPLVILTALLIGSGSFVYINVKQNQPVVAQGLIRVAWLGSQFVAVGDGGTIITSPDGRTWTARHAGTVQTLVGVAWSGSQFVVVGTNGTILTSPDGIHWTAQASSAHNTLADVVWAGTQFVAVGLGGMILTSPDGVAWTTRKSAPSWEALQGIAWSGSTLVATSASFPTAYTSPDGVTWTEIDGVAPQALLAVQWSGSQFVACGYGGTIVTSPDGRTWTTQHSGTLQLLLHGVAWSGSQFVVVGTNGTILTSPDGRTWTARHSGTLQILSGVAWSGSQFVAVERAGTILTSPDGRTWTAHRAGTILTPE